jgi:hypothetical protein
MKKIKKTKTFCFENSWIKHEDFKLKDQDIWGNQVQAKNAVNRWYIKLNRVKKFLKGWDLNLKDHTTRYKNLLQKELLEIEKMEELNSLSAPLLERKTFIQSELHRILEGQEEYWHKRLNLNWLLKGDNNTDFFHKVANGKKRKNTIFSLQKDGENIEGDENILNHATH